MTAAATAEPAACACVAPWAAIPLFAPLAPWLDALPDAPARDSLCALAGQHPRHTAHGRPITFGDPPDDGLGYEERIARTGLVATRPDNWHDFFNALVWLAFPQAKQALSAAHALALAETPHGTRGPRRDALTHLDECGLLVAASDPALLEMLRHFAWQDLFVTHRAAVRAKMRFIVFGHATYERLRAPFHGLTAKAMLYEVTEDWLALSLAEQMGDLDRRLAADIAAGQPAGPRDLQPVPVLGIPGVTPASENPAYYADTGQFRPGRMRAPGEHVAVPKTA